VFIIDIFFGYFNDIITKTNIDAIIVYSNIDLPWTTVFSLYFEF